MQLCGSKECLKPWLVIKVLLRGKMPLVEMRQASKFPSRSSAKITSANFQINSSPVHQDVKILPREHSLPTTFTHSTLTD